MSLRLTVKPDGNAERSGLLSGDILMAYKGEPIHEPDSLTIATQATAGTSAQIRVEVMRAGEVLSLYVESGVLGVVVTPCPEAEVAAEIDKRKHIEAVRSVIVTTAPSVEGFRIVRSLDVVSSEYALGLNVFKDILTAVTDTFGGRSGTLQQAMRQARVDALNDLRSAAHELGGNAVIATRIEYTEFSGQGKSMLLVAAYGTAVVQSEET